MFLGERCKLKVQKHKGTTPAIREGTHLFSESTTQAVIPKHTKLLKVFPTWLCFDNLVNLLCDCPLKIELLNFPCIL